MSTEKPQLMKCPGCQNIVDVSKYGAHMLSNHTTDNYVQPIQTMPGTAAKPKAKHWLLEWFDMYHEHSRAFIYLIFFFLALGYILGWYR
jgi:hypothetical protein